MTIYKLIYVIISMIFLAVTSFVAEEHEPLKKYIHHEEATAIRPNIILIVGRIPPNSFTNTTTMTMDLAPTFASISGIELINGRQEAFDGIDLSPVFFEEATLNERILFWRFNDSYAVRESGWKYIVENGNRFLFNLDLDQTESINLMNKYPAIANEMEFEYQKWLEEVQK